MFFIAAYINYEKHTFRVSYVNLNKKFVFGTFSCLRRSFAISTLYAAVCILAERFLLYRKQFPVKKSEES